MHKYMRRKELQTAQIIYTEYRCNIQKSASQVPCPVSEISRYLPRLHSPRSPVAGQMWNRFLSIAAWPLWPAGRGKWSSRNVFRSRQGHSHSTRWANDLIFWVSRTFQTCGPAFLGSQVSDHGARNSLGSELMQLTCLFADWPPLNVTTCNLIVVIILQIKYVLRWPRCQGGAALCRGLN